MAEIVLKGRRIPLVYTVLEMKSIQEEIAPLGKFQYLIAGRNPEDNNDTSLYGGPEHLGAVAGLIRILGNAGLEEAGEDGDLTDRWVLRALRPAQLAGAIIACTQAIQEGMETEIKEDGPKGKVDVTLAEIKKNEEKDG